VDARELLRSAYQRFESGDYRAAHALLELVDRSSLDSSELTKCRELESSLKVDPFARSLAVLSFLLFLSVLGLVYLH
jgi:hypothetical protein